MSLWVCSNIKCRAVWNRDPRGHCPACVKPDGGGWSTSPRELQYLPIRPDEPCPHCGKISGEVRGCAVGGCPVGEDA